MLQNRYHAVMVEWKDNANSALYHASLVISEINGKIFPILIKNVCDMLEMFSITLIKIFIEFPLN